MPRVSGRALPTSRRSIGERGDHSSAPLAGESGSLMASVFQAPTEEAGGISSSLGGGEWVDLGDMQSPSAYSEPPQEAPPRMRKALLESFRWHWRYSRSAFCLSVVVMLVFVRLVAEAVAGISLWQAELVSSAVHGVFDLLVLGSCLLAMLLSKVPTSNSLPFGFARAEVLSAFANACYLLFLAFTQCTDALNAALTGHLHGSQSVGVAGANVAMNLLGSVMFSRYAAIRVTYSSANDMNLHAVWLHLAADSVHNGALIASALLRELGLPGSASAAAVKAVSAWIMVSMALPLFTACANTLLQRVPTNVSPRLLNRSLSRVAVLPGCRGTLEPHFWELAPGQVHGQVIVLVDSTADATSVRNAAAKIFEMAVGFKTNIVIEVRLDEGGELMASAPAANGSLFQ